VLSAGVTGTLPLAPTANAIPPGPAAIPFSEWYVPCTGNECTQFHPVPLHLARPPVIIATRFPIAHDVPADVVATPVKVRSFAFELTRDHVAPLRRKASDQ
jgi:hypothetical protein